MPQIAEPITSLEQELESRIEWLENGLKQIAGGWSEYDWGKEAQAILDGEPTTADKYNDEEDIQIGSSIVKSNDNVSGVFMVEGKIKDIDYNELDSTEGRGDYRDGEPAFEDTMQEDEKLVFEEQFVRISDVNKEIAVDWKNREREEKIEKINKRKK